MALRVPPPEIPVITFLSPNKSDQGAIEFWNTELSSYVPLDIGAPHPNQRQYPNFRLGRQAPVQGDEKWVLRTWVTDETNPDWFNWSEKFAGEDAEFPTFVRTYREPRDTYTPRTKGTPLGTLYKTILTQNGSGYANGAYPSVTFSDSVIFNDFAIAHGVVAPDGTISEVVLDFGGEGYGDNVEFTVASPINGSPAAGIAYVQPQIAVLTREEASLFPPDSEFYAQYLQVTRVYETIPGPTFHETSLDVDGAILTTSTTRKFCSDISTGEEILSGTWCKTTSKPTDIDVICEESVVCREIPGNPMLSTSVEEDGKILTKTQTYTATSSCVSSETLVGTDWTKKYIQDVEGTDLVSWQWVAVRDIPGNDMESDRLDDDGVPVHVVRTMESAATIAAITPRETLITGTWTKITSQAISDLVAWKIVETRAIPGNPMVSTKIDDDGAVIEITKVLGDTTTIVSEEIIDTGFWIKTYKEVVSDLVANQVQEVRAVPGNPMTTVKIDKDGIPRDAVRTLKDTTTITPSETVTGGVWITTEKEAVSDLVAWEVVTAREVEPTGSANPVVSYSIDGDHETVTKTTLEKETGSITPSATESGGNITTVEAQDVTDLVAQQVTTVVKFLDKAEYMISIVNLIPREFMAFVPTFTESHILSGTASMPTLASGEFEHSKRQLTKLLYEERIVSLGSVSLPITHTNQETTEEYGGGVLNVTYTLETQGSGTIDEGLLVTESTLTDLGNGMEVKLTKELDDTAWSVLASRLWDDNFRVEYDETKQVVAAGTSEDPDPGGGTFAWVSEVKGIDKWRSLITNTSKPTPSYTDSASAFISYKMEPFRFPGYIQWSGYGYYTRGAYAVLVLHKIRTWWVKSSSTPTVGATGSGADVEFDEIITDDVIINNLANTGLEYAKSVLHDGITIGVLTFPATTPSATEYVYGTVTGSTVLDLLTIFTPGTGYLLGDSLSFSGDGGSASVTVTAIGVSGSVFNYTPLSGSFGWTPAGSFGPYTASGGSGSGAEFVVLATDVPTYDPSTKWIGVEHVIGASVTPEKEKDIFKIQTEAIVMR